jgi:polysaccharide biosynthesis/export protein
MPTEKPKTVSENQPPLTRITATDTSSARLAAMAGCCLLMLAGCVAPPTATTAMPSEQAQVEAAPIPELLTLKEGDVLKISFPSVPTMDSTQQVRQDGRITLPIIGECVVIGRTTDALTKELLELYSTKLVSKEVTVTLVSSSFAIYVTGAVLRPGKIMADRRISAFDAIMEAGGFDKARADLKAVTVVRQENGQTKNYTLNLQEVLDGTQKTPFYLKPFDTVYVRDKFSLF